MESTPSNEEQKQSAPKGIVGRLKKGAGTHLASWLQEVDNISNEEALVWLAAEPNPKLEQALAKLKETHGKNGGHANKIIDASFSGELLVTKDDKSMRLWRARDCNLLRVIGGCLGNRVVFSPTGNNIVTGTVEPLKIKIWGPAGGSAVGAGNAKITASKA